MPAWMLLKITFLMGLLCHYGDLKSESKSERIEPVDKSRGENQEISSSTRVGYMRFFFEK